VQQQRYDRQQEKKMEKPQAQPVIPAHELKQMLDQDFQSSK